MFQPKESQYLVCQKQYSAIQIHFAKVAYTLATMPLPHCDLIFTTKTKHVTRIILY